jgi:outer membrane lipoprotein-sorting protein
VGREANVMKRLRLLLFALIVLSLLIAGCVQKNQENYSIQENKSTQETYKPTSESQINQFIEEKNVTFLANRTVGNSTVVLYENESEMGVYQISIDETGNISWTQLSWANNSAFTPVSIGGTATGIPFVAVIINDDQMLKKAYKVTVVFRNKDEVTELVNNSKGIIIPDENVRNGNVGWSSVTVFDKDNNILFKKD